MFKSYRTLPLVAALALLSSITCYGQADSTIRRSFTPMVRQESGTSGFSQILTAQSLQSQGLAGSPSGGSPMIAYGPYTNTSGAMLTVTTSCIEGADRCIQYVGLTPATVTYGNFLQVPPGSTYMWLMRDYGFVNITAMGSGLGPAGVGLPPASAFATPTVVSSTNSYQSCKQNGTDNGDGTFTPDGTYTFLYSSIPVRSDKSSVWGGGGGSTYAGPNPGVSTSTCAAGVGTFSGGSGGT